MNLSVRQVADPDLARRVAAVLAETGAEPADICLEVTESFLLEDSEAAISAIGALKDLGVSLAIDDFGTGYSSLSYLSRLPVDVVKIDKSFVDRLDPIGGDGAVVASAIISLATTLGLATIAEGVTRWCSWPSCTAWAATRRRASTSPFPSTMRRSTLPDP